jgi:small GTP-binding protein
MNWPKRVIPADQPRPQWALKVLFIGDEGVGKTDLMCNVSDGVYIDGFRNKLGSSFGAKRFNLDPQRVQLQIWNLTPDENFKDLRKQFYRGSAVVIYVFSLSDRISFEHILTWVEEVRRILGNVPAILVGTRRETQKRRHVTKREAKELARHLGVPYLEVGMEKDLVFEQAIQNLVSDILNPS